MSEKFWSDPDPVLIRIQIRILVRMKSKTGSGSRSRLKMIRISNTDWYHVLINLQKRSVLIPRGRYRGGGDCPHFLKIVPLLPPIPPPPNLRTKLRKNGPDGKFFY